MNTLTIQDLITIFKKKAIHISVICIISSMITGYLNYYWVTPIYANSTTLLVNDRDQQKTPISFNDMLLYEKLMGTYKDIIRSKRILRLVAEKMEPKMKPEDINSLINTSTNANSQVITITVSHPNFQIATKLANIIAETFSTNLQDIMSIDNVQILDPAEFIANPKPVKPNRKLNIAIAFFLGFLLSFAFFIFLYLFDTRVRTEEDLNGLISFSLLGSIPNYDKKNNKEFYR